MMSFCEFEIRLPFIIHTLYVPDDRVEKSMLKEELEISGLYSVVCPVKMFVAIILVPCGMDLFRINFEVPFVGFGVMDSSIKLSDVISLGIVALIGILTGTNPLPDIQTS